MAYAAVISLKHNIEHLTDPAINPKITTDAYNTLSDLGVILQKLDAKNNRTFDVGAIKELDAEIRKAAWKIEDVLESHAFRHSLPPCDNNGVEKEIQSLIKTVKRLGRKFNRQLDNRFVGEEEDDDDEGVSPKSDFGGRKHLTAIGFLKDVSASIIKLVKDLRRKFNTQLDNPLDGEEDDVDDDDGDEAVSPIPDIGRSKSTRAAVSDNDAKEILKLLLDGGALFSSYSITLVGMAGIGKTHYATEFYQHPLIVQSFDFTAWARVGQKCRSVSKILLQIVSQIERKPRNLYVDKDVKTLSKLLKKSLDGGTCLVVLDDIWSKVLRFAVIKSLEEAGVKYFLLTTRIHDVYIYMGNRILEFPFMNNEDSWALFWRNVFPNKSSYPPQLEKAGKKIAEKCEGLPLLILAVADILSREDKTEEHWNKVAVKKTTTFVDAYERISQVLSSSYDYLPQHLKACFLYLGVFPQSSEFSLRKLIILLTVEEFLEPNQESCQPLERFIMECLKKLVENSVLIRKNRYNYDMKSCKLHSAYWYLCVKEARSIKFLHVLNKLTDASEDFIESQRRISVQNSILLGIKEVRDSMAAASTARSLLFTGEYHEYPVPLCYTSRFLKVLDAVAIRFYEFPEEVVKLLLLRYLSLTHNGKLPSSISNLQKLQYLISRPHHNINLLRDSHSSFLPREIWDVQQLKFLWIMGHNLPDPSIGSYLPNLETLYVNAHSCTKAVFRGLPNLKKLVVRIELQPDISVESLDCLEHITCLGGLESLTCVVANPQLRSQIIAPPHHLSNLPRSLVKVSLNGLGYSWKYMSAIGSLPNLRELKLRCCTFQGTYWETMDGQFQRLDFMLLEDIDLEYWLISKNCFTEMKHITIRHCYKLKEIILEVEALRFLFKMEVFDCSPSLVASALQMGEKLSYLEVVVNSSWSH